MGVGQDTILTQRSGGVRLNPIEPGITLIAGLKSRRRNDQSISYIGPSALLDVDVGPVIGFQG